MVASGSTYQTVALLPCNIHRHALQAASKPPSSRFPFSRQRLKSQLGRIVAFPSSPVYPDEGEAKPPVLGLANALAPTHYRAALLPLFTEMLRRSLRGNSVAAS